MFSNNRVKTAIWYDNTSANLAIAPYQIVMYASAAEVATANAAGIRGGVGDIVVVPTIAAAINTHKIAGVVIPGGGAFPGGECTIAIAGIAEVMCSAAGAWDRQDAWWFCGLAETRTNLQTPLTDLNEMLLAVDPRVSVTYQLAMATRPAVVPATGAGTNAAYYPLGYALEAPTHKYDVFRLELVSGLKHAEEEVM